MVTFIHNNPIVIRDGRLTVDRKFHTGMQEYSTHLSTDLLTVHPLVGDARDLMDPVELSVAELPYKVLGLTMTAGNEPDAGSVSKLDKALQGSEVVVGWGYGVAQRAEQLGKRYIACLEYDLQTQILATTSFIRNPVRKAFAALKIVRSYYRDMIPAMRNAHAVHCNGYPMYRVARDYNPHSLLYLDSRLASSLLISGDALQARLDSLGTRPLRLIFSGRFEKMKGALHAVTAARKCLEAGLDLEMHCYGSGSLREKMQQEADRCHGRVTIHNPVRFEELVRRACTFDLFVCCHTQSDPSCTYIESMGAGLPIIGYGNRMWSTLAKESGAGIVVPRYAPGAMARAIISARNDLTRLAEMSHRAQSFAAAHCFEHEFRHRSYAIQKALEQ